MADTRISIILDAKDNASRKIQGVADTIEQQLDKVGIAAGIAAAAITAFSYKAVQAFLEAESASARLRKLTQNTVGATDAQVDALIDQAEALERVGVVSADVIVQTQGTLATFDLQTETIEKLIPSLLDMAVAERGVGVTSEQLYSIANGLSKAMQGQMDILTKMGFQFTDAQMRIFETGTEMERAATLVDILSSTYDGMNESMRQTTEGGIAGMKIALDNLMQTIGGALIPAIEAITPAVTKVVSTVSAWVEEHPKLTAQIITVSLAITGFVAALAAAGPVIGVISQAIALLGTPIGYVIAAFAAISIAVVFFRQKIMELWGALEAWGIIDLFRDALNRLWEVVQNQLWPAILQLFEALKPLMPLIQALAVMFLTALVAALLIAINVLTLLVQITAIVITKIAEFVAFIMEKAQPAIDLITGIITSFTGAMRDLMGIVNSVTSALSSFISKAKEALSLNVGGLLGSVGSAVASVVTKKRAYGGPVAANTPYTVGENGPETFVPSATGRIIQNGGGIVGGGMTVIVSGNRFGADMSPADVADAVGRVLMGDLKMQARV